MSDGPRDGKRYRPLSVTMKVTGIPQVLAMLQKDMADILRHAAEDEPPAVAKRLREIAALFETGLRDE